MAQSEGAAEKITPAYLAYETFRNFIQSLHTTAVPDHVGRGMMPTLSSGSQSHLLHGLKFLKLIEQNGNSTAALRDLAKAFGSESWGPLLAKSINSAYAPIMAGLSIATTTDEKLYKAFKEKTQLESTVVDRAVRFYIKALRDAKVSISPHLGKRKPRKPNKASGKTPVKPDGQNGKGGAVGSSAATDYTTPSGMIDFPIPVGQDGSFIRIPKGITMSQFPMVRAVADVIEALAKQNTPSQERQENG